MSRTKQPLDPDALVREHGAYVWRTLRLLGIRSGDVEDVAQEVLITAVDRHHTRRSPHGLRSWIRGICVKKAAGHRRKAHHRREVMSASPPERTHDRTPADALSHSRQLRRLHAALSRLNDDQRAAFVLFEIEGLSMAEVAETLGCPLQTAYARHRKARACVVAAMRRPARIVGPPLHLSAEQRPAEEVLA